MRAISLFRIVALAATIQISGSLFVETQALGLSVAHAETAAGVTVTGNSRVDRDTIASYLVVKSGRATAADIDASVKALFGTNLFSDVKITRQGGGLLVAVKENPVIMRVLFEGNQRQDDDALGRTVELQPRSMLTQAKVQSDTQRLLELYRHTGRYNAKVTPKVIDRGENRVDLVYQIEEGVRTEITKISFVGNKSFGDGRLKDVISTEESGLLSWFKSTSNYDPDRLNADREALRRFYISHGFPDARIISADANFDRQNNAFYVTFSIEEGDKFTFGKIDVQTSLKDLNVDALKGQLKVQEGGVYNAVAIDKSTEAITAEVSRKGYAFGQVRPRLDKDFTTHAVAINFYVDEGARAYVERIDVVGNTRTRDYVIRREFDVSEGDAFNQSLFDRAQRRLQNLGYFKSVKITNQPGSAADKVVVVVTVEDQPTGQVSIGAGYSTSVGFITELSFSEKNFLGRGQRFTASVSRGSTGSGYELAFTEPYLFDRRLAGSIDLYRRNYTATTSSSIHPYAESLTGGTIGVGVPIVDDVTIAFNYGLVQQKVTDVQSGYASVLSAKTRYISSVDYTLTYNTIDDVAKPHDGNYAKWIQQLAGFGGDARYLKSTIQTDVYRSVYDNADIVAHLSAKAGNITGVGKTLDYLDQFHLGGEVVRGFDSNGFGPRDSSGYQLGGQYYIAGSAETIFPMPLLPKDVGMNGAFFVDAGTLWKTSNYTGSTVSSANSKLRASVGTSLIWQSPFGLIRADVALPVLKDQSDKLEYFRISGGTTF